MRWLKALLASFLPWHWFFKPEPGADILLVRDETGSMLPFHSAEEIESMHQGLTSLRAYAHREIIVRDRILDTGTWASSAETTLFQNKPDYQGTADIFAGICLALEIAIERSKSSHRRLVVTIRSDGAFNSLDDAHRAARLLRKLSWIAGRNALVTWILPLGGSQEAACALSIPQGNIVTPVTKADLARLQKTANTVAASR